MVFSLPLTLTMSLKSVKPTICYGSCQFSDRKNNYRTELNLC